MGVSKVSYSDTASDVGELFRFVSCRLQLPVTPARTQVLLECANVTAPH
jgi:hypothetical protein